MKRNKAQLRDYVHAFLILLGPFLFVLLIQSCNYQNQTIYQAASDGNFARYKYLIENQTEEIPQDKIDITLNNALKNGHADIARYILENNLLKNIDKNKKFSHALGSQDVKTIKLILDLGIDKDEVSKGLFYVRKREYGPRRRSSSSDLVDLLVEYGADVNFKNKSGVTPLYVSSNDYEAFQAILNYGAEINVQNKNNGNTITHHALKWADNEIIRILIKKGADFTIVNTEGNKPVHLCYRTRKCPDVLKILQENKIDIYTPNEHGKTLLHISVEERKHHIIDDLINLGFDLNAQDNNGDTPLHLAARWKLRDDSLDMDLHPDALVELLKFSPDVEILNTKNQTALDVATEEKVITLLKEYLNSKTLLQEHP